MKCPHCSIALFPQFTENNITLPHFGVSLFHQTCPSCGAPILEIAVMRRDRAPQEVAVARSTIFPAVATGRVIPEGVPEPYNQDFIEAIKTLPISPKASAALSRRIIQALLREKFGRKEKDLAKQIDEVLLAKSLPSYIADDLHSVRNVGNFAAHETKDRATGEIIDVDASEAEWILGVAGAMIDFCFVEPAKAVKRRTELNEKLKAAGKPTIDETSSSPSDANILSVGDSV